MMNYTANKGIGQQNASLTDYQSKINSIEDFLNKLKKVQKDGKEWKACCPAHEDKNPSLNVTAKDDKILVICRSAGCTTESICESIGLKVKDLFLTLQTTQKGITLSELARDKKLPSDFLYSCGLRDEKDKRVSVPYYLEDKSLHRKRYRTALKAKDGTYWDKQKKETILYGLWLLDDVRIARELFLVEGESDCWTIWYYGNIYPTIGMPGGGSWNKLQRKHLERVEKVYVIYEKDEASLKYIRGIEKRLQELSFKGEFLVITFPENIKDVNDLHRKSKGRDDFKAQFEKVVSQAVSVGIFLECNKKDEEKTDIAYLENNDLDVIEKPKDIKLDFDKVHPIFRNYALNFKQTECTPEQVAASFLVSLGSVCKIGLNMGIKTLRTNLWLMQLGKSTLHSKSTSLDLGTIALKALNEKKKKNYEFLTEQYKSRCDLDKKYDPDGKKEPVKDFYIYPESITGEKMIARMSEKPDGIFLAYEMGGFLAQMSSSYSGSFKQDLTRLYDGQDFDRDTKSSGEYTIKNPAPSIMGASTLEWVQSELKDSDLSSGFLARFLYVYRNEYSKIRVPRFKPTLNSAFYEFFEHFEKLYARVDPDREAEEFHDSWYNSYYDFILEQEEIFHTPLSRLMRETIEKIALINHALECIADSNKDIKVLKKKSYVQAIPWIDFFQKNVFICYNTLSQRENPKESRAYDVILRKGKFKNGYYEITSSALMKYTPFSKTKDMEEILETLEMKNLIHVRRIGTKKVLITRKK